MSRAYVNTTESIVYFIAHNGADVVHPGVLEPGIGVETGQPTLETFTDEAAWKARAAELGVVIETEGG